ncbi:hypothetical protein ACFL6I_03310 [candidate division KSB1 bacterium]
MEKQSITGIIDTWENTGTITDEMADTVDERFEDIIRYELGYLSDLVENDKPHRAFGRLSRFLSFLNMIMEKKPAIQQDMEKYIYEMRKRIDLIAKGMEAKEYHLTLEMPTGISITMVFKS